MLIIFLLIVVIIAYFVFEKIKKDKVEEVNPNMKEEIVKNKEILKEKIQTDLKKNKIISVYVSKNSKKFHSKECRYYKKNMEEMPLDIARKNGYLQCKVCR